MPYISHTIHPNGIVEAIAHDKTPSLEFLQGQVGGYIERIPGFTKAFGRSRGTAWANEEGLLLSLDYNLLATKLWRDQENHCHGLVGPVLIVFKGKTT